MEHHLKGDDRKMNNSKIINIIMTISLILFVAMIGLIVSMNKMDKLTEETTSSYTATVIGVDVVDTGVDVFAEIQTKENSTSLYISANICKKIDIDEIRNLRNGQTIFFRIENIKKQQMNTVEFINITSLKTDTKEIFSLEEYNKCMHSSVYPARIAGIIIASLFLSISILCYLKNQKTEKTNDRV